MSKPNVVIIGNGISGVTAARYIRKRSDCPITIISAESKHFFSRTALMYVYMGHQRYQDIKPYEDYFWEKNRIGLIQAYVEKVDFQNQKLNLSNGKTVDYDVLILATGSRFNKFGWKGQDLRGVGGLVSLQDLDYMEEYTKGIDQAVVVGGGLIGIEMVEMLLSRHKKVTFLVREPSYWNGVLPPEESAMVNRHIGEHHVDLQLGTSLLEILPDETGRVRAVITSKNEEIPCQWVGLTAGVSPNVDFLKDTGLEINRGIKVNDYFETSVPNVYAIGDCAEFRVPLPGRTLLEQVWYTGKMHGETVALTITGKKTAYKPATWFNSAKFFDIEYQTYGRVSAFPEEGVESLYWEHPEGRKSIRINYRKQDQVVTGFNTMGIRFRHKVCEKWIDGEQDLEHVLTHLSAANFDPEFFSTYEGHLVRMYNQQTGSKLKLKSRSSLSKLIFG
ncbi:MAG: FAD-dependent oxidoreductase [Bacteroidia bacterium]|nr:FAD-dependent oxidoreductase [Bacteroidia bacterium]